MKSATILSVAALLLAIPANAEQISITTSADVTLYENSFGDTANGIGEAFFIGKNNSNSIFRSMFRFDIAGALPAGATIDSVTLTLYCDRTTSGAFPASLHRVDKDWGEGQSLPTGNGGAGAPAELDDATWLYRFFVPPSGAGAPTWDSPGGDFDPAASATTTIAGEDQFYSWTSKAMASDVQAWLDDPAGNFGWLLHGVEDGGRSSKRMSSREHPVASQRPALTIVFTADAPCLPDLAEPFGVLDIADVQAFIAGFEAQDPIADVAAPQGVFDLADVQAFIAAFVAGCP